MINERKYNVIQAMYLDSLYICSYDTGKITGYAVPRSRDKEVSLTSGTVRKKFNKTNNYR
jgi:hypothetical protein